MKILNKMEKSNGMFIILKGSIFSIFISSILLLIFAIVLTKTNIQENTIKPVIIIISSISILIGSSISTIKTKKNGIFTGMIIGIMYFFILYVLSSFIYTGFKLNLNSLILGISGITVGAIGRNCWSKYKQINKNLNFI